MNQNSNRRNKTKRKKNNNIVNEKLLNYDVLLKGIESDLLKAEADYETAKEKYKKDKNKLLMEELKKSKKELTKQKQLRSKEIKQINFLNKKPKGKKKIENDKGISIEVKNIRKYYASKKIIFKALDGVDLKFKRGSFNVILGPSGSGKTTLLNSISGLDRATSGEVIINGTNIQSLNDKELTKFRRDKIGFVFQSYNLLGSLNVNDNIEVGRSLQKNKSKRQDIKFLLNEMEMIKNKNKMTYELSGGQQQRVSIARAISKTPEILIGDEPTGAIDRKTSAQVFKVFKDINKKYGTTIIIVTHNPNVALLGDQVIHVQDGEIEKVEINKNPKPASFIAKA